MGLRNNKSSKYPVQVAVHTWWTIKAQSEVSDKISPIGQKAYNATIVKIKSFCQKLSKSKISIDR